MPGMSPTRRRNRAKKPTELPFELRKANYTGDLRSHWNDIAAWLNSQVPGTGGRLATPMMLAAGVDPAAWYRERATTPPDEERRLASTSYPQENHVLDTR